jgi:hypothetical protein
MVVDIPGRAATEEWQTGVRDQALRHERVDKEALCQSEKLLLYRLDRGNGPLWNCS